MSSTSSPRKATTPQYKPVIRSRRRKGTLSASGSSSSSSWLLKGFLGDKIVWVLAMGIVITMALAFCSETPKVWNHLMRPASEIQQQQQHLKSSISSKASDQNMNHHWWVPLPAFGASTEPPIPVVFPHSALHDPDMHKQQHSHSTRQDHVQGHVQALPPFIHQHDRHHHPIHKDPDYGGLRIKFPSDNTENQKTKRHQNNHLILQNQKHHHHDAAVAADDADTPQFTRVISDFGTGPGPFYRTKDDITQDDDYQLKYDYIWNDEIDVKETDCRFPKMRHMTTYTCNNLHEEFLGDLLRNQQAKFVGHGDYKRVFAVENHNVKYVYKTSKIRFPRKEKKNKDGPGWDYDTLGEYTMDGRISSLLGRHPLLVDFYNFCSLSMQSEFLDLGDMEQSCEKYEDRCEHRPVPLSPKQPLASYNNYTAIQKLSYALDMAEGVALLHNHPLGVIVHDDIQLGQFLLGHDGHIKFNDFNRGVIMMYDEEEKAYCKYNMNGKGPGDWRSPEEYRDDLLDQQMDIYSLGNNYYSILTGFYPLPNVCEWDEYQKVTVKGKRSYLDPRWTKKSYAEGKLTRIIKHVWQEDPSKRPSIGDLVRALRTAYKNSLALENKSEGYKEVQKEYDAMLKEADAAMALERKGDEDPDVHKKKEARKRLYGQDKKDDESDDE